MREERLLPYFVVNVSFAPSTPITAVTMQFCDLSSIENAHAPELMKWSRENRSKTGYFLLRNN
jgi:hypothetical protein